MNQRFLLPSVCLALLNLPIIGTTAQTSQGSAARNEAAPSSCAVTVPRKSPLRDFASSGAHWEGDLYVAGLPSDGTMVFQPEVVSPDGSLGQKYGWYRARGLRGKLTITGKKLDGPAAPLGAHITDYGDTGFQPSTVIFPTEGCWEVTGRVDKTSLTFVLRVVTLSKPKANAATATSKF